MVSIGISARSAISAYHWKDCRGNHRRCRLRGSQQKL